MLHALFLFLSLKSGEMLMLTGHWRIHHPPPPPSPSFGVDVQGWQRSRVDDCIHTSAHRQRSRQAERKVHILSTRVFALVNCALSTSICSSWKKKKSMMSRSFFSAFSQCMPVATLLYHSPGCFLCCSVAIHSWNITRLVIGEFHIFLIFQVPTSPIHYTQCVELNKCALLVKSKSKSLTPRASGPGNSWLVHNVVMQI